MHSIRAAVCVVLIGALTAGCEGTGRSLSTEPGGQAPRAELDDFYEQKADWRPCSTDSLPYQESKSVRFECAKIEVPLDYSRPSGKKIKVAVNRLVASDKNRRIGSLLTNPGGPGSSGLDFLYLSGAGLTDLRERYDIVGMDPRGVGKSHEIHCMTRRDLAAEEKKAHGDAEALGEAMAAACKRRSGELLSFVGTDNVARDLDVVRGVLGDKRLNFYGASYGTLLGQFYAHQFPKRTGRMVLDSVVDPTVWPGDSAGEAVAYETALKVFVQSCIDRKKCRMGSQRGNVLKKIDDLITKLDRNPWQGPGKDTVTGLSLVGGLIVAMKREEQWSQLQEAFGAAFKGDMKPLVEIVQPDALATEADSRESGEDDRSWDDQSGNAVRCLHLRPDQRTHKAANEAVAEVAAVAPVFREFLSVTRHACVHWPAESMPDAGRALRAEGAPEILLVQNSFDAATPVQWARSVEGQLDKARLVTNVAGGHGFYGMGECTKKVVDGYLLDGTLPARGKTCHDRAPGIPQSSAELAR